MAIGSGGGGGGGGRSGAVRAGQAFVELGTRDSGLTAGLERAKSLVLGFGKLMVAGIGVGLGALAASFKSVVEHFDQLNKAADRTGATTEALSALEYAAKQSDATLEDVASGAKFLQKTLSEAAGGSKEAQQALDKLGLTADDLKGKSLDEQFAMIADGLAAIEDPADRTAAALQVLGRGGLALVPMLKEGSQGLRELKKEAEDVGAIVSGDQARAATRVADSLDRAWTALVNTFRMAGAALLPFVDDIEALANGLVLTLKLMREMAPLLVLQVRGLADMATSGTLAGEAWQALGEQFNRTWTGMKQAIAAGDILLAFKVGVAGLEVAWAQMVVNLTKGWNQFKGLFVDGFHRAVVEVKKLWIDFTMFMTIGLFKALEEANRAMGRNEEADKFHGMIHEEMRGADLQKKIVDINAKREQAERDAARALDGVAAAADLAAAKLKEAGLIKEAEVAANTAMFARFMADIAGTPLALGGVRPAVIAASHGTFSTFGGGRQMFGGGGGVLEDIKKNTGRAADDLDNIKGKLPARFN